MNFFRSVFSDDPATSDLPETRESPPNSPVSTNPGSSYDGIDGRPTCNPGHSDDSPWSFGGMIKNLTSKSESVIQTYRRDLAEFGSELRKETAVFREVASRAVKDLPESLEAGASVAQGSLESVGQAIDDFGSSVWRGTAGIISKGKETLLASDHDDTDYSSDNSQKQLLVSRGFSVRPYSRFDTQLRAVQTDDSTYSTDPADLDDYNEWVLGFYLEEKAAAIRHLLEENKAVEGFYKRFVPNPLDPVNFWRRYFYRIHKLKQAEDARADLVKRAISKSEEELSWDVDDDDDETNNVEFKGVAVLENVPLSSSSNSMTFHATGSGDTEIRSEGIGLSESNNGIGEEVKENPKGEAVDVSKDSDFSVVSMVASLEPEVEEEEDLGWDDIDDTGSNDEGKVPTCGTTGRTDQRSRLSASGEEEEEEELSWDIEDDDEPLKPK